MFNTINKNQDSGYLWKKEEDVIRETHPEHFKGSADALCL